MADIEASVSKYSAGLVAYAYSICGDLHASQDAAQEAFISLIENSPKIENEQAWLYKVCRNKLFNSLRKHKREGAVDFQDFAPVESEEPSVFAEMDNAELMEKVFEALKRLREDESEILNLKYFSELSYKEIAEVLEIRVPNVGVRINRAMASLRSALSQDGIAVGKTMK